MSSLPFGLRAPRRSARLVERGKGIALAMKLRALRTLNERGVKLFGTTNDEQNAAMRGINKKLGYVPDPPTVMYAKTLS